jgi:hypothetical protein
MRQQQKQAEPIDLMAHDVRMVAVRWTQRHLPDRFCPTDPEWREERKLWRVPLVLAYPGICLGEVGELWIDADNGGITAHTEIAEMETRALKLGRKNRAQIQAAFLRTRKV